MPAKGWRKVKDEGGAKPRRETAAERDARLREMLTPPEGDPLVIDGHDMSLSVQHPRFLPGPGGTKITLHTIFQDRIAQWSSVLDGAFVSLQAAAIEARKQKDMGAVVLIQSKLAEHASRMLTSSPATGLKPETPPINLEQFTPETQALLIAAFEAAEREMREKGEGQDV